MKLRVVMSWEARVTLQMTTVVIRRLVVTRLMVEEKRMAKRMAAGVEATGASHPH